MRASAYKGLFKKERKYVKNITTENQYKGDKNINEKKHEKDEKKSLKKSLLFKKKIRTK